MTRPGVGIAEQETTDFLSDTLEDEGSETVGLTLLAHPDASRVGEVAALFSARVGGARERAATT